MDGIVSIVYSEYRHWSVIRNCQASRISVPDNNGAEFFAIIPTDGGGKAYREARERIIDLIIDAIESGSEPGEVDVSE